MLPSHSASKMLHRIHPAIQKPNRSAGWCFAVRRRFSSWLGLGLILPLLLFFPGCSEKRPILLGFSGCLTGYSAGLGVSGRYGAALAVEDINAAGGIDGRPLELLVRDDQNNPDIALAVDKALHEAGVTAIVGHMTSDMATTVVPWINETHVLMMSPTIADPSLTGQDDWFFRVIPESPAQAQRTAEGMWTNGIRHAAVLYENTNLSFTERLAEAFVASFGEKGGEITMSRAFDVTDAGDISPLLEELTAAGSEAVFLVSSPDHTALFLQMRARQQADFDVYLAMWSASGGLLKQAGSTAESVYLVDNTNPYAESPAYLQFVDAYEKKYGEAANFASLFGYESVLVLAEAMRSADSLKPGAIREEILKRGTFPGLQGDLVFDATGDMHRETFLFQVRDGNVVATGP